MSATNPGFNFTKTRQDKSEGQSQIDRLQNRDILPAPYPFWTRHAAFTGMAYIDYNPFTITGFDTVNVSLGASKIKFTKAPLVMAWCRDAASDLSYSDVTQVFKVGTVRRNSSGTALDIISGSTSKTNVSFSRTAASAYGLNITYRVYIKFFIFSDEPNLNQAEGTVYTFA